MERKLMLLLAGLFVALCQLTAQTQKSTGQVLSADDGQPIVGASVLVTGTTQGTITDIDGNFTLNGIPSTAKTLRVSYIGMQTQEVAIKSVLKIVLQSDAKALDEVVVTGYGVTKKAAFTGAASILNKSAIETKNDANPIKALDGSVPGLQLSMTSGQPGAPADIYIRGRNSLNSGTQPLYVVDGVSYFADAVGVRASSKQTVSPLASLNANDIESVTVLKDATATSIYGSRAANGVIVITTKKGQSGKPKFNFTAKIGIETMPSYTSRYKQTNAAQNIELATEALLNGYADKGDASLFGNYNINNNLGFAYDQAGAREFYNWYTKSEDTPEGWLDAAQKYGYDTDWIKEITRTGLVQEYGFDVSGGGKSDTAPKYYISLNYMNEDATVRGKGLTRYSFRSSIDHAPSKYIKYGVSTNLSYVKTEMGAGGGYYSDPITMAMMMNPLTPVKDRNGNWNFDTSQAGYNPVAQRSEEGDKSTAKQYRAIIAPYIQLNFSKKLFWITRASTDLLLVDEFGYWSFLQPQGKDMRGMGEDNYTTNLQLSITNTLNYLDTFNERHHVNFLIGQEGIKTMEKGAYLAGSNYPVENLNEIGLTSVPGSASTERYDLVLNSYFANAQYDYDNKYYASASFRYDGSSRFGSNHRWAPFWSVGAKYRLTAERFMEPTESWLTDLTIRASYGTSGNQEVGATGSASWYAARDLFDFGYVYNNLPGMAHAQFGNDDLKWEQTQKFNVGLDVMLFKRINITVDYYNHKTKDMVFNVPLSMTTGLKTYYKNIGKLANRGFEASINVSLIQTMDWKWDVTLNGSINRNKVEKLSTDNPIEKTIQTTEVGYPIGQFKMKEYAGVDPQTGSALWYKNATGNETTTSYNAAAKRYLGSPQADFAGAFSTSLKWKGIDFALQLNYSLGGKIYGDNLTYDEQTGATFHQNFTKYVYDNRWRKPGDITDVPRITSTSTNAESASSRFLMDADYLKIRSISIGYSLPKSVLEKIFIQNCRIFANLENLYTVSASNYRGFDPTGVGATGVQWWNYPQPRTFMFGVNLGF
ncbi:MAG: TonB-dependent receptor [Mediterranea sp.]|jgi:TonB-linked SusC/RagA family outer membrane protein|nr:TonB-dependent receptor [Mediterranea sp.]